MPKPRVIPRRKGLAPQKRPVAAAERDPLEELLALLRGQWDALRRAWVAEATARGLLAGPSEEADAEATTVYDALLECLATGRYHTAQTYAHTVAERGVLRGIGAKQVIGRLLVLRDMCGRAICRAYRGDERELSRALDLYEPVIDRVLTIVAMAFLQEREKAVGRGREQLEALVDAGMILAGERSLESVLQRIVEVACRVVGAKYGALGVLDERGTLGQFITTGITEEEKARIGPLPVGKGILGLVVSEARAVRLRDLNKHPGAHGFPPNHPPMRSFLGVPIASKGRIIGNLYLTEKQGADEFSREDERLATTLGAQAAIAIENASLYGQLQRSYDDLKQSQDLLVRQEKLASLGRLAAGLAHELNNPLSSVAGYAEALQRRAAELEGAGPAALTDLQEYVTMIQAEASRAAGIIRNLLDFARQREPAFGFVNLLEVVRESVAFVQRQARLANQQIVVAPFPNGYQVVGDAQMLQQVFLNLLTNALDATEGGGEIRISARERPGPGGRGGLRDCVEVTVVDSGVGIAPEDLARIFDPFFTTKAVGRGTGLGLAISQSIVEQHGGALEVRSEGRGTGTVVSVVLPLAARAGVAG